MHSLMAGYAQSGPQPPITCDAINEAAQPGTGYNPAFVYKCITADCHGVGCSTNGSHAAYFTEFTFTINPCRNVTASLGFVLNMRGKLIQSELVGNASFPVPGEESVSVNLTLVQEDSGIIFAVSVYDDFKCLVNISKLIA